MDCSGLTGRCLYAIGWADKVGLANLPGSDFYVTGAAKQYKECWEVKWFKDDWDKSAGSFNDYVKSGDLILDIGRHIGWIYEDLGDDPDHKDDPARHLWRMFHAPGPDEGGPIEISLPRTTGWLMTNYDVIARVHLPSPVDTSGQGTMFQGDPTVMG